MNKIQYLYAAYAGILESNPPLILEDIMCAILVQSSKENNMPLDYPQASIVATSKEQNKRLKSS